MNGLLVGIGSLVPLILLVILDNVSSISYVKIDLLLVIPMFMAAFACFFFGALSQLNHCTFLSQRGSLFAGVVAGSILIGAGIGYCSWRILNFENWAKPMEGSVVRLGPIMLPGVIIAFLPSFVGILGILGSISILIRTFGRKRRR